MFCGCARTITCVLPNDSLMIYFVACALELLVLSCEIERHPFRCVCFRVVRFRVTKQVLLARTQICKNVWHCTRKGFSAQKLPNTTNIVVSATRAASSFRSTKLILLASRHPQTLQIQWFERLGAFRSTNIIRSASVCSRLEASERRNHCVCSAKRV